MTVKEAEEILKDIAHKEGCHCEDCLPFISFLECHELYKPLVEVLESVAEHSCLYTEEMNNPCEKCLYCKSKAALKYHRTKILGEKDNKPLEPKKETNFPEHEIEQMGM